MFSFAVGIDAILEQAQKGNEAMRFELLICSYEELNQNQSVDL